MKKPNNPFLSYPLNSEEQHLCIKYANNLLEYAQALEKERDELKGMYERQKIRSDREKGNSRKIRARAPNPKRIKRLPPGL